MFYKIFNIPIPDSESELERMNKFLSGVRIISSHKELVTSGGFSYWSFVIEYFRENGQNSNSRKSKIDYREILSEEDFAVYCALRDLRKNIADQEGVPVYTIFTNEQLAEIVKRKITTKNALSAIQGIGDKKIEKYGEPFIRKSGRYVPHRFGSGFCTMRS